MHVEVECPILARVYRAVATALFRQEIASLIRAAIGRVIMRLEKKKKKKKLLECRNLGHHSARNLALMPYTGRNRSSCLNLSLIVRRALIWA